MNDTERVLRIATLLSEIEAIAVDRFHDQYRRERIDPHKRAILEAFLEARDAS